MLLKVGSFLSTPFSPSKKEGADPRILEKRLFDENIPTPITLVSGIAIGSIFMTSDYTSLYRSFEDVTRGILAQYPHDFAWLGKLLSSKHLAVGYQTFGSVTGINFLIGLSKMIHSYSRQKYNAAIGDKTGLLLNRIGSIEGASLGVAGLSFITFRILSIIGKVEDGKAGQLLTRIAPNLAMTGLASYGLFFGLLSTIFGVKFWEGCTFKRKLGNAKSLVEKIEVLQRMGEADPLKIYEKLVKKYGSEEEAKKHLIDEAYTIAEANLSGILKELNIDAPKESLKEVLESLLASGKNGASPKDILVMLGLKARVHKIELKKQAKLSRILGSVGFSALKEAGPLSQLADKIRAGDADAIKKGEGLVAAIKAGNKKTLTETGLVLGVLLFGMVAMIAAIVLTGGIGLIVSSGIMLTFGLLMTAVDGYYLHQSYKEEAPAAHDKKMLIVSSVLAVASFLLMIGLGAAGVMTFGILPMIISSMLTILWLGQNAVSWHVMNRNQRLHDEKNPTFETILKALDRGEQKRVEIMIRNLPSEQKQWIKEPKKEAVISAMEKIELAKGAHLEILRKSFIPHLETVA